MAVTGHSRTEKGIGKLQKFSATSAVTADIGSHKHLIFFYICFFKLPDMVYIGSYLFDPSIVLYTIILSQDVKIMLSYFDESLLNALSPFFV